MLVPAWAVTLWLGVRLLKHGFTLANAAALLAAATLAAAVKAASYALRLLQVR